MRIYFRTSTNKNLNNRPEWFDYDRCWKNLLKTRMGNHITVIHDGPIDKSSGLLWLKGQEDNITIKEISSDGKLEDLYLDWQEKQEWYVDRDSKGREYKKRMEKPDREKAAGSLMYDIIYEDIKKAENKNDIIYMVEDDYIHLEGWPVVLDDVFNHYPNLKYASLYDHPDKYTERYKDLNTYLFLSTYSHWRFTPSTCGTFAGRISAFLEDEEIHKNNLGDHNKFVKLTEKNRVFVSCVPSIATHCVEGYLAPYRDWAKA